MKKLILILLIFIITFSNTSAFSDIQILVDELLNKSLNNLYSSETK